jgi:hypothetical protein
MQMKWAGHVAWCWRSRYLILVGEPDGKRPRGMLTCRLEDNIKMDLKMIYGGRVQMDLRMRAEVLTTVSIDVSFCSSVTPYGSGVQKLPKNLSAPSKFQKGGVTPTTVRCHRIF